jgi:hypothetical protein
LFEQSLNAQALRLGTGNVEQLSHAALMELTPGDLVAGARSLGEHPAPPRGGWFSRRR